MMDAQIHRGPDDFGLYQNKNIVLGHRRLAIIDLSPAGRQPMSNEDGTIWITYNGEIYNYRELREMLIKKGHKFKSNSDTEVIIHGYEEWGVDGLLQRLRGMFAFAIYDPRSTIHNSRFTINYSRLILARDRIGIKPLYYSYCDDFLLFASGLNAILASKLVSKEIDPKAVVLFLLYGSIPPPQTIYKEIFALEPGHFLIIDEKGLKKNRYYDLKNGFLDTSLMGISFPDTPYDESRYSKIAARKFNTDHAEIEITGKDLINHMDKNFYIMDQPTVDGVNTYFVSWATNKSGLKVAMSGVGGDEIFWGYPSFTHIPRLFHLFKILSWVPLGKRTAQFILRNSNSFKTAKLYSMVSNSSSILDIYLNYRGLFTKEQIYKLLHQDFVRHAMEGVEQMSYLQECSEINDEHNQVSLLETTFYMANQLLRDTDVFSMAHSLEVRVPFVDHTLVELLAKIPARYKTIYPKRLLIKVLNNKLPDEIVHRPKMGFTFPLTYGCEMN